MPRFIKRIFQNLCYIISISIIIIVIYDQSKFIQDGLFPKSKQELTKTSIAIPTTVSRRITLHRNSPIADENRLKSLEKQCGHSYNPYYRGYSKVLHSDKTLNYLGFLLQSHSLFYCAVPKVATRTILPFITYLHVRDDLLPLTKNHSSQMNMFNSKSQKITNTFNSEYIMKMIFNSSQDRLGKPNIELSTILTSFLSRLIRKNASKVDLWLLYEQQSLPYIRLRNLIDTSRIFSANFTRAIFVRHPLDRLASAYIDKIASLKNRSSSYDGLRQKICQHNSLFYLNISKPRFSFQQKKIFSTNAVEGCRNVIPTFEHFLQYIFSKGLRDDVHWQPYTKLCQVCLLKYNFIGKYETIGTDLQRLMMLLGINSQKWNQNDYAKTGKTKENYQSLYKDLSYQMLCTLKRFYHDDFNVFNYRFEDYLIKKKDLHCPQRSFSGKFQ
ncbi:unnamed protein product [Adineta ricciae]|uniref:Carbohydrate sulfotransferase n=1 Tax=Adineta ricciae TaxID=249248 RepID=A0A814C1D7_ADIRI|nr:unnamed protein product [Adineta ricciae]CAF1388776.1 unnamed protein product [Adineta ricciae]